jgi:hypothetical protein
VIDGPPHAPSTPALGAANHDVLGGWLGLSDTQLDELRSDRVI